MGSGDPLIILHGLFGSSDNWQTLGKRFAEDYEVYLVDQRNHGHSAHDDLHDYQSMSDDLLELIYDQQLTGVNLLGHSMGGKTVIKFAHQHDSLLNKIIVVDMGIKSYPPHHEVILDTLASLNLADFKSRKEADAFVSKRIDNPSIRQFLLKNLYWKSKGQLAWRMNLDVITNSISKMGITLDGNSDVEALFLYGGSSNYILDEDKEGIMNQFPLAEFQCLKNTGHWLHAEKPDEFFKSVVGFLED